MRDKIPDYLLDFFLSILAEVIASQISVNTIAVCVTLGIGLAVTTIFVRLYLIPFYPRLRLTKKFQPIEIGFIYASVVAWLWLWLVSAGSWWLWVLVVFLGVLGVLRIYFNNISDEYSPLDDGASFKVITKVTTVVTLHNSWTLIYLAISVALLAPLPFDFNDLCNLKEGDSADCLTTPTPTPITPTFTATPPPPPYTKTMRGNDLVGKQIYCGNGNVNHSANFKLEIGAGTFCTIRKTFYTTITMEQWLQQSGEYLVTFPDLSSLEISCNDVEWCRAHVGMGLVD